VLNLNVKEAPGYFNGIKHSIHRRTKTVFQQEGGGASQKSSFIV